MELVNKLAIFLLLFMPINAYTFCMEPSPPFSKPSKPSVPYCVNEFSGTHTCDDYTISSYNNSIRSYNYEVENYVNALQRYVSEASDYANCEIRNLD